MSCKGPCISHDCRLREMTQFNSRTKDAREDGGVDDPKRGPPPWHACSKRAFGTTWRRSRIHSLHTNEASPPRPRCRITPDLTIAGAAGHDRIQCTSIRGPRRRRARRSCPGRLCREHRSFNLVISTVSRISGRFQPEHNRAPMPAKS